jgi:hypothetical protein
VATPPPAARSFAVAIGGFQLIYGALFAFGGYLLIAFHGEVSNLRRQRSNETAKRALNSLARFWMFIGIVLIIGLAFFTVAFLMALSAGAAMQDLRNL